MEASSRRQSLFWIITLGAGLAGAVAIAELALRIAQPEQVGCYLFPCIYWSDTEWGYRYRPNAVGRKYEQFEMDNEVHINSQGFHDRERVAGAEAGALRVAAIGDSFTAAIHVPIEETWTQVAERLLSRELLRRVQVYNLGLDGTGTPVHLSVLERMLPALRPDVVVLAFFANDFEEAAFGRVYRECYQGYVINYQNEEQRDRLRAIVASQAPSPRARAWFERSYLSRLFPSLYGYVTFALLRENYLSPSRFGVPVDAQSGTDDVAALFESFLRLSEEWGFAFVVVPVPMKQDPQGSLALLRDGLPEPLRARLDVVDVSGAIRAELTREGLGWSDLYWKRDAHFDVDGNRIFGQAVAAALAGRIQQRPARVP